ncbi:hypothetical protein KJZ99_11670 [bacterium]|nr:hypothetical protein [bacterium]
MLRMLLIVIAAVLAVRLLLNLFRPRGPNTRVGGKPHDQAGGRKYDDIEDADFREIK